jgi:hypothetical protein
MKKKFIISVLLVISITLLLGCSSKKTLFQEKTHEEEGVVEEVNTQIKQGKLNKAEEEKMEFTEGVASDILIEFNNVIYSSLEEHRSDSVSPFTTKEKLSEEFQGIATPDLIKTFVDTYFIEKDGGLYPREIDAPLLFNIGSGFKIDKKTHKLKQRFTSDMAGTVDLEFSFLLHNNEWLFSDLKTHQTVPEEIVADHPVLDEKLSESQALGMVGQALRVASIETYEIGNGGEFFIIKAFDKETNQESFYKVDAYDRSIVEVEL